MTNTLIPHLIGVTGYKRSGKGETGNFILEEFGGGLAIGFADLVKIAGARALGFDRPPQELVALMDEFKETATLQIKYHEVENGRIAFDGDPTRLIHDLTGREYLQFFGTESGRNTYADNFWVDLALPPATHGGLKKYEGQPVVVFTDVRFDNEAQRIKDLGGINIEVRRPGTSSDGHPSEAGVNPELIDYIIENDGELAQLQDSVQTVINDYESTFKG